MLISDWSSDVCSSDLLFDPSLLHRGLDLVRAGEVRVLQHIAGDIGDDDVWLARVGRNASNSFECQLEAPPPGNRGGVRIACACRRQTLCEHAAALLTYMSLVPASNWFHGDDIGRASCRERVCQYV